MFDFDPPDGAKRRAKSLSRVKKNGDDVYEEGSSQLSKRVSQPSGSSSTGSSNRKQKPTKATSFLLPGQVLPPLHELRSATSSHGLMHSHVDTGKI
jgi:hypothetical protein